VKAGLGQFFDLTALDHSAVSHKRHPLAAKALTGFAHLRAESLGVLRIAAKHFRRDGCALFIAQQADDDLLLAFLAVAVVAVGAQSIVFAFQVAAGDIVEEQLRLALRMSGGEQPALDLLLVLRKPSQILIQIVFVEAAPDAQQVAGGMCLSQANGGKTRALIQEARDDLPQRQLSGKIGADGLIETKAAGDGSGEADGADGSAFLELYSVERGEDGQIALMLQGEFDRGDLGGIAVAEVGDIALFDLAVLAEGFAEVDGLVGLAVGGGPAGASDVHVYTIKHYNLIIKAQLIKYQKLYACLHIGTRNRTNPLGWNRLPQIARVNIRCRRLRILRLRAFPSTLQEL
jgi:hypothetical protein